MNKNKYQELSDFLSNAAKQFIEEDNHSDDDMDAVDDNYVYVTDELDKYKDLIEEEDYNEVYAIIDNTDTPWSSALIDASLYLDKRIKE